MRIGCLWVPDLSLVSLVRAEPALAGVALAIAEPGPSGVLAGNLKLTACTEAAIGVEPGMTIAAAQSICPTLLVRAPSPERMRAAAQAALEAAGALSPRLEEAAPGLVFLDLDGLAKLFPEGDRAVAQSLAAAAEQVGLRAAIGLAEGKTAARLAAKAAACDLRGGVQTAFCVIEPHEQRAFLAGLPLQALEISAALLQTLHRFGLATLGDLARLPPGPAAARLGAEGAHLLRVARCEDVGHLVALPLPERFDEGEELEWDASSIEPLLFVWKGLLDRLCQRLSLRGLAASELTVSLRLGSGARDERTIALAAPTREVAPLLQLLRLEVEARPPGEPIRAVRLSTQVARARHDQLGLFGPRSASPGQLEAAIARLSALLGEGRVGRPVAPDTFRPLAATVARFDPPAAPLLSEPEPADTCSQAALSARALRPPVKAEVRCDAQGRPAVISDGARLGGRVLGSAGPWRTVAEWWTPQPLALDTFDLEVVGGLLLRASKELQSGAWWIEAVYD